MRGRFGPTWVLGLLVAAAAQAGPVDWGALAERDTVEIVTRDEDGGSRETKIWIVSIGGEGYIRTGSTRWYANLERDPAAVLRVDDSEIPVKVRFVQDPALVERAEVGFREKYGGWDRLVGVFRQGDPHIMQLLARP